MEKEKEEKVEVHSFPKRYDCNCKIEWLEIKENAEYVIFCMGANGSNAFQKRGGKGAILETRMKLYQGEILEMMVGEFKESELIKEISYWHGGVFFFFSFFFFSFKFSFFSF